MRSFRDAVRLLADVETAVNCLPELLAVDALTT